MTSSKAATLSGYEDTACTVTGPSRAWDSPQILQPGGSAERSGTDQRAWLSSLTWEPPAASYPLSSLLPTGKSWFAGTVTVGWMWMLKGSENTVLARGKSQRVRGTGRTTVNAARAVMGGSAKAFEKGYILAHHPPAHTPCRQTQALVDETFRPRPPWGSNLKTRCIKMRPQLRKEAAVINSLLRLNGDPKRTALRCCERPQSTFLWSSTCISNASPLRGKKKKQNWKRRRQR